ncbi:sigma 54-interacting transcriptional regulator [Dehalobacter sp. DCM]|uniref:sigma-54 interaction domain-containing protein n=1 Tax=Dehalobacter sp. DCM TaxID=2907827 RepID=UPI003081DA24|nr:sigma 54-interacting transcriptional regulator [Dehalobacter sp. DCM]
MINNGNIIFRPMSRERWDELIRCKQEIQELGPDIPLANVDIDPRIADCWIRCYREGMRPDKKIHRIETYDRGAVSRAMSRNEALIEAAKSVFDQIYQYQDDSWPFYLELVDRDNVRLLERGVFDDSVYNNPIPDEHVVGMNCHSLMREHHCPMQVCGPENYLEACYPHMVWGAPVFDDNGNYYGGIFLSKRLKDTEWGEMSDTAQITNLYLISAIAIGIERCWTEKRTKERSEKEKEYRRYIQDIIMNLTEGGMIILDRDGYIIDSNRQAISYLGIRNVDNKPVDKLPLTSYLKNPKTLSIIMQRREATFFEGGIITDRGEKNYTFIYTPLNKTDPDDRAYAAIRIVAREKEIPRNEKTIGMKTKFCFNNIIGESAVIKETIAIAKDLAMSNENILLTGESGTGKELFAQAIHSAYKPDGPFIALNCAAFPRSLIESELFGYEQGTFTGAEKHGRPGKIELANGGTLFLDEIGDMPIDVQAILLRVLQDKQVVRIGSVKYKPVDFRIIAATNQNLKHLIDEKRFRQDLYFRLAVLPLTIPPLREREGDIELLSSYFLEKYCLKNNLPVPEMTLEVKRMFRENQWPGNVRELENAVVYCISMSRGKTITTKHVFEDIHKGTNGFKGAVITRRTAMAKEKENDSVPSLDELESLYVEKALQAANNNVTRAAAMLGISKTTLYRRMKKI